MEVLVIGRIQGKRVSFVQTLERHYSVRTTPSGKQGISLAQEHAPSLVIVDAVSMRTRGDRVSQTLRECLRHTPIIHIHPGPKEIVNSAADLVLFEPLTARRLFNNVERLLQSSDEEVIACGPFVVNVTRRTLTARGQEIQLTPKVTHLLEVFFRNPGQTLDRKMLMEDIWQTDYLGDTRTLDVHIRWVRKALGETPGKHRHLITIRGIGYRFDCDE